jgi:hypothetical protein
MFSPFLLALFLEDGTIGWAACDVNEGKLETAMGYSVEEPFFD